MSGFERFVGIDWSGANGDWQNGIAVAVANPGMTAPRLIAGPGPKGRWSRETVVGSIVKQVRSGRTLIGIDFAFGFPTLSDHAPHLTWEDVERYCRPSTNLYGGAFFKQPEHRFSEYILSPWHKGLRYSSKNLRETERQAAATRGALPSCMLLAIGPAAVGMSSLSGMRALAHLKRRVGEHVAIWPFDIVLPSRSVIVEVFPRYFPRSRGLSSKMACSDHLNAALSAFESHPAETSPRTEDEGDAIITAAALRNLSEEHLRAIPPEFAEKEGWIFGVPPAGHL